MGKITVGKKRSTQNNKLATYTKQGNLMFILGIITICIMLALPMTQSESREEYVGNDAVAVMSSGVEEREELAKPEVEASTEEQWSVYDYIGKMIAELLFGD